MAEQAVRKAIEARRLHPALLAIELNERDSLQQLPGHGLRQQRARLGLVLAHDEPHLGRALAPPRAPHALQKARDRERRIDLERPLKPTDVDAQLERGRCHDGEVRRLVAHPLFRALADGRRQVAMVDEEPVLLPIELTVRAQRRADFLCLLPRVREDQTLMPPRMLKDVADARVGVGGCDVSGGLLGPGLYLRAQTVLTALRNCARRNSPGPRRRRDRLDRHHVRLNHARRRLSCTLVCLGAGGVEVLHRDAPGARGLLHAGYHGGAPGAGGEEGAHGLGVADGRREADAPRLHARQPGQPFDEAQALAAAVLPQQGVNLVYHDVAQVAEELGDGGMAAHEQRLERLRRDLQDAGRTLHELGLVRGRDVSVPVPHVDAGLLAEVREAVELVVDEGLGGAYVERPHRGGRPLPELREDGEEGGLGLTGGGGGAQQDVVVRVEDGLAGRHLDAAQALPLVRVDEVLHERRISVEDAHVLRPRS